MQRIRVALTEADMEPGSSRHHRTGLAAQLSPFGPTQDARSAANPSRAVPGAALRVAEERARQPPSAACSIKEFCASHSISRALYYLLQNDDLGPREMRVRGRVLISAEAAAQWRRRMEGAL